MELPDLPEVTDNKLNVICLSGHTSNDMSRWSHEMSQEREELTMDVSSSLFVYCFVYMIV